MHPKQGSETGFSQDGFLGEKLRVRQPRDGFRSGHDAVLLAAASDPPQGGHIIELGSGAGVASLCFAARRTDAQITGLEIDPQMLTLAQNNAEANDLGARAHFKLADISGPFNDMHLVANSYDEVIANPPFYKLGHVPELENDIKARALIGTEGTLDTWVKSAAALAKARGYVTFIHRADALAQLLTVMQRRLGDIHVLPVLPKPHKAATRVLIRGRRDARAPVTLLPPLVLQDMEGQPSPAAESVLRHGAALAFAEAGG
jgi:tRNA1(Val) A37 N6-methylase TrmN6